MRFEFVEDVTLADTAVRSYGKTLPELFENTGLALFHLMTGDTVPPDAANLITIELTADDPEMLLYDYLNEFLFYRDARSLLIFPEKVEIGRAGDDITLKAQFLTEKTGSPGRELGTDVKAVTFHRFSVTGGPGNYIAFVVYDL